MPDDRDNPIDPPDNQGGGNLTEPSDGNTISPTDSRTTDESAPIDPPDNQGGGN